MLRNASGARRAARVGALLVVFCGLFACGDGGGAPPGRPNVVWIVADDMSFEVGAFGDSVARTPNLDRLAREGVRYTNAFATAGVCAPSRATLITGMYATSIGAQHMRSRQGGYEPVPPPGVKTFTEYLRAAGYYTSSEGKLDYQFSGVLNGALLTNWDDANGDWRGRAPGQPFFAHITIFDTHESQLFGAKDVITDPDVLGRGRDRYYRATKPVEELYDTATDPFELDNLAGRPEQQGRLGRMRAAQEAWVAHTGDLGAVPEAELAERFWPGGLQPVTPPPTIEPAGGAYDAPVTVTIRSDVEGASLAYAFEQGNSVRWHLYAGPIRVTATATVRARAVRYGWSDSAAASAQFEIASGG